MVLRLETEVVLHWCVEASGLLTKIKEKNPQNQTNFRMRVHLKDNKYKIAASGTSPTMKSRRCCVFCVNFILSHSTHTSMSTVWFHFLLMENKEVMVCTFPGTDFLGFNAVENYRFIKQCQ